MDLPHLCQAHKGKCISVLTLQHNLCAIVKHAPVSNSLVTDHNECVDGDDIYTGCLSICNACTDSSGGSNTGTLSGSFNYVPSVQLLWLGA